MEFPKYPQAGISGEYGYTTQYCLSEYNSLNLSFVFVLFNCTVTGF